MRLLFSVTLFVSAVLLFLVQPMIGKMILPLAGGTPAVWTTCMVFFQAALLGGYLYAHAGILRLGPRGMAGLHPMLLGLPLLLLIAAGVAIGSPLTPIEALAPQGGGFPFFTLTLLLLLLVGTPFFFLATSAPLVQRWFAATDDPAGKDPYFLYAASNLGSFLGLILYPMVIEKHLALRQQAWLWAGCFALWAAMTALCAAALKRSASPAAEAAAVSAPPVTWPQRIRWLGLAAVPSSLMLSVVTYATTDIAPIPLFFIVPLGIYLLTFVFAFGVRARWVFHLASLMMPMLLLLFIFLRVTRLEDGVPGMIGGAFDYIIYLLQQKLKWIDAERAIEFKDLTWQIVYHVGVFTAIALMCHLALAQSRPAAGRLTEFYLWVSLGGVLGGLFNAVAAPLIFVEHTEYAVGLLAACFFVAPGGAIDEEGPWPRLFDFIWPVALGVVVYWLLQGFWSGDRAVDAGKTRPWFDQAFASSFEWIREHQWKNKDGEPRLTDIVGKLRAIVCFGIPSLIAFLFVERPLRFGLAATAIFVAAMQASTAQTKYMEENNELSRTRFAGRSFFGTLSVNDWWGDGVRYHKLVHGTTLHGQQAIEPVNGDPLTYYHRLGPVGDIFTATPVGKSDRPLGFVGLGSGSLSAYGKAGQSVTYFEIDNLVKQIATNSAYFTYVTDAKNRGVKLDIVMGDARLKLKDAPDGSFALLAVDAFSSDSIPVHLLTKEALEMYFRKLAPDGVLALHVSNRYLALDRVVARLAEELGKPAFQWKDQDEGPTGKSRSDWIVLVNDPKHLGELPKLLNPEFQPKWQPLKVDPEKTVSPWTDDFSNVLEVFSW